MYNLIEYRDKYSKTLRSIWHYYRDEPVLDVNGNIVDFSDDINNSVSFIFKTKISNGQNSQRMHKNLKIMVSLKYLGNFWKTLEMPIINYEINVILTWSANYFIVEDHVNNQAPTFALTGTNIFVLVATLSTQENEKLLQQLELGFKRRVNCNKYWSKVTIQERSRYLDYIIDSSF